MELVSVSSTNLRKIGYDASQQILRIVFNSGTIYDYYNVPEYVYEELSNASSKGQYFSRYIKGSYNYSKV